MALNFPNSPSDGETFLGTNGINYVWSDDDQAWQVYNDPSSGIQVWSRNPVDAELFPVYPGDGVGIKDSLGEDAVTITGDGDIFATGKYQGGVDIESYPALP